MSHIEVYHPVLLILAATIPILSAIMHVWFSPSDWREYIHKYHLDKRLKDKHFKRSAQRKENTENENI